MNDAPRQTLRELIARHGPGLCSDARRCEGLLRDLAGQHRREINILVSALKERVPLDLLAGQSAMPRGLLVARLAKRLEDQLALTDDAARWAVDSWALALGVMTEAEVKEREAKAERDEREKKAAPSSPASANAPRPAPPPQREQQQQGGQPPTRATTSAPKTKTSPPPTVARPASRQPSSPPTAPQTSSPPTLAGRTWFPVRRRSAAPPANATTTGPLPFPAQAPVQDPSTGGRRRTLRGCTVGCLLLVVLALAVFVGGPFVLSVLREEQERRNLEPSPVLSP